MFMGSLFRNEKYNFKISGFYVSKYLNWKVHVRNNIWFKKSSEMDDLKKKKNLVVKEKYLNIRTLNN